MKVYKHTKVTLIAVILIVVIIFLTSCWSYKEINHLRIVTGLALDYDQNEDLYTITIEVIKVSAGEDNEAMSGETFECKGVSTFDAIRNMIAKTGRRLYWSDATTVVISEDIAKKGIIQALDILNRGMEIRTDILLFISREKTAGEILDVRDLKRQKLISYHMENISKNEGSSLKFYEIPVWRFVKDLYSSDISPSCPGVKIITYEGISMQQVGEIAVFKKDKLVGWLDETDSVYFLWATDRQKSGILPITVKEKNSQYEMALEILRSSTKKKAEYINNELTMSIDINTTINIGEVTGKYDFSDSKKVKALETIVEEQIKNGVENLIHHVQKEYNSDIFGFGVTIKREMPNAWKNEIKPDWDVIFPKLKTVVNVDVQIRGSSLTTKPIEIQD